MTDVSVRRYVSADIPAILKLAKKASEAVGALYEEKRLKFVLDNNVNNNLIMVDVMVDIGEVVGVLIAESRPSAMTLDKSAYDEFWYVEDDYRDSMTGLRYSYLDWARQRGCKEALLSNKYMPEFPIPKSMTVWKETL
ncbi:MAG: hypothetical protein MN733_03225 [Nitrososphaera sp.]|nr:hypothetical protein [Nitrososphaera sp.]